MSQSVLRLFDIRTRNNRFTVVLSSDVQKGFTAKYWSSPAETKSLYYIDRQLSGTVSHQKADTALFFVYTQLEGLDGPILKVTENLLSDGRSMDLFRDPPGADVLAAGIEEREGQWPWTIPPKDQSEQT